MCKFLLDMRPSQPVKRLKQITLLMKATPQMLIKKSNRNLLVEKTKTAPLKMYNANLKVNQFNQT